MNLAEAIVLLFLFTLLTAYLSMLCRSWKRSALLALAIVPALYASLETASQFLTVDEIYIIRESADLDFHYMVQWYMGANRTTETFMGVFSRIVRSLFSPSDDQLKMLLKLARFALGFMVLLLIHRCAWRRIAADRFAAFSGFAILFFYAALLLPVSALALRIFNYDCLSMYLATLALLLIADALERKNRILALLAVAVAYLAAQEKMIASPVLIFCLVCVGIVFAGGRTRSAPFFAALYAPLGVAVALATGLACVVLVGVAGVGDFPRSFLARIVDPLAVGIVHVFLRYALGVSDLGPFTYPRAFLIMGVAPLCVAAASSLLLAGYQLINRLSSGRVPRRTRFTWLVSAASALVLTAGIAATFLVRHHFQYFFPGDTLPFVHTVPFNNMVTHFGATTAAANLLSSVGYAYAVFVNAVPSVFWIMIFAAGIFAARIPATSRRTPWYEHALLLGVLAVPLVWGAARIPVGNRYFNLFVFLFVVYACVQFARFVAAQSGRRSAALIAAAVILLVIEVLPFRPMYAAFRPFWSSFPDSVPQKGLGNPVWVGWGEEVMLAGRILEKEVVSSSDRLPTTDATPTLYCFYPGDALSWSGDRNYSIKLVMKDSTYLKRDVERFMNAMGKTTIRSALTYDSTDFFLFNRFNCILDDYCFPATVTPRFTLSWRGYPMAWLYRGDELKKAGFLIK